jgi:hypothetical protein
MLVSEFNCSMFRLTGFDFTDFDISGSEQSFYLNERSSDQDL